MDAKPTFIHPTALVETGAQLGANVRIGPFCHVGSDVTLGDDVELMSHVSITGPTEIGAGCTVHPQAVLGGAPQNAAYKGEPTRLIVGRNVTIREGVTMHRGTGNARGETVVGDHCMFLAYSHVAHDCIIGDHVTFANNVMIGGHVTIGDRVIVGGGGAIHQFCTIGNNAFIGGLTGVAHDVIPYGLAMGSRAYLSGLNLVGMKRAGMSREQIGRVRQAFNELFADNGLSVRDNARRLASDFADIEPVQQIVHFVLEQAKRQLTTPLSGAGARKAEGRAE
ncbi:acyl-ACP--UDP-N-acetylglucosamine O-acyltransferase [Roseitalea porphyridii]|uniref:Acyl-[acyl-carrier-protein]--UDP-N-acetylglucosamine O-acyltransferase n=1 Tax=Roseitalea porphyridii TaxID=1852022 RepID=A0A4P6V0Q1_9HYPH|nr:acyl-ACP--UDP-N-acetylglucosamine O-acyltransferase [Roseitalea porphyridii]QBK30675.1 acyl-ACP--UDP-N-acetylglucosamine O-acyltransferase [Roseitalea porphyridii]